MLSNLDLCYKINIPKVIYASKDVVTPPHHPTKLQIDEINSDLAKHDEQGSGLVNKNKAENLKKKVHSKLFTSSSIYC